MTSGLLGPAISIIVIYLVESGLPLPIPEDVFVLYLGYRTGMDPRLLLAALTIMVAATLGSLNLYYAAKKWGRAVLEGRLGRWLRLTPERIERIERWFLRWGAPAIIFGRYLPGPPIPITVAAGIFRVRVLTFIASVMTSVGIWAAIELVIGAQLGHLAVKLAQSALHQSWGIWVAVGAVGLGCLLALMRVVIRRLSVKEWLQRRRQPMRDQ